MQIEVIKLDKVDHQRIKGLATIKVEKFGKIVGIRVTREIIIYTVFLPIKAIKKTD